MKKTLVSLLLLIYVMVIYSQGVTQWRGKNRDGIYDEKQLLPSWPVNGPKLLWLNENIGKGYGSPVITNDKLFINGEIDSVSHLFAFDLKGQLLWKVKNGKEFFGIGFSANYPGARSTPTLDGNYIYTTSGLGQIGCFDATTGKEIWTVNMVKTFNGFTNEFGYCESVVVDDKNVYCFPGGKDANYAALDKKTGKTVWTCKGLNDTTSFCSPLLVKLPSREVLVTFGRHYLVGIDTQNGELLWSYKLNGFRYDGEHCNTPLYSDGFLYNVAADPGGNGTAKLQISTDGKSIKEIWRNLDISNGFGGFVKVDNKIFMTVEKNYLKVLDLNTGLLVDSTRMNKSSIIFADNKFICYGHNGEVKLINYENKKLETTGKLKIDKGSQEHISHPVISNGVMYIRHGNALMVYNIKNQ